jgi:hypothetical protein
MSKEPKFFFINYSNSFKQFFYGTSFMCFIFAIGFYFDESANFVGDTKWQLIAFLLVLGTALIPTYHLLSRLFKSDYVQKKEITDGEDPWLK